MAKAAKPATQEPDIEEEAVAPPKKSKKKLIVVIAVLVLLLGGGAAAFLLLSPPPTPKRGGAAPAPAEEARSKTPATFVDLGQFTANLMHEEEDRYLQVTISLKLTKPELEEKIKETKPEILHRVNMLLQSKHPSELSTIDGKERLAQQIKAQVEYVLGLRKVAPVISSDPSTAAIEPSTGKSDLADVLFTSFIIQ
jgi:flagellar FliL protein